MVGKSQQLFANVLNIDLFVYSFGSVVSNKTQANTASKSNGTGRNMGGGGEVGTGSKKETADDREMTESKL